MLLLLAGLAAFAESALGVGLVLPGETTIVALAAASGLSSVLPMILAVALGATSGDHVGYLIGRRYGPRLEHTRVMGWIGVERWDRAAAMLNRRGTAALLGSRMLPVVRTVMPAAAGAAGLSYGRFVVASVAGSLLWASLWVSAGSTLGAVSGFLSTSVLILLGVAAALTVAAMAVQRLLRRNSVERDRVREGTEPAPRPGDSISLSPARCR